MLNIDTRLLDLIPEIGADAFVILCLIAKRINKNNTAFPSIDLLQKESGFGRDKTRAALKKLKDKELILISQLHKEGRFTSNIYTINTDLIGVYISAKGYKLLDTGDCNSVTADCFPVTENQLLCIENQTTENQTTENQTLSISKLKVLNNLKVLDNIYSPEQEKKENKRTQNKIQHWKEDKEFCEFLEAYGKFDRNNNPESYKLYSEYKISGVLLPHEAMLKKAREYNNLLIQKAKEEGLKNHLKYKCGLQVWLRQERFLNDFKESNPYSLEEEQKKHAERERELRNQWAQEMGDLERAGRDDEVIRNFNEYLQIRGITI